MPAACPAASSRRISAALSAAKASASQAPVRLGVAIYRTFSRPGMPWNKASPPGIAIFCSDRVAAMIALSGCGNLTSPTAAVKAN